MEHSNGENSQQYNDSGGGGAGNLDNPTGRASITIPLSSASSPSPSSSRVLTASTGSIHYLIAEATRFSSDIKRLSGELAESKQRIAVQDEELAQLQDQVHQQTQQLNEAAVLLMEQQNKIAELEEEKQSLEGCTLDTKELKKMVAFERKAKIDADEKLQKLKEAMKNITGEFHQLMEEIKGNGIEIAGEDNDQLTSQNKLDRLSVMVQEKFETWAASQIKLKSEVINMNAVIHKLANCLQNKQGNFSVSSLPLPPQRASSRRRQPRAQIVESSLASTTTTTTTTTVFSPTGVDSPSQRTKTPISTSPIQIKEEISIPAPPPTPKTVPGNEHHAEDTTRFNEGFFCICGQNYSTHSNLRIHVRTFTEEGKFKCSICKNRFVLFYMLRRHLKDKHNINNSKSVGCSICGDDFSSFSRLYEHRKLVHPRVSFKNRNASSSSNTILPPSGGFYDEGDDDDITFIEARSAATAVAVIDDETDEVERPINYFGKRHGLDVAKRHQGFFCICGSQLLNRRKLDIHVRRSNQQDVSGGVISYAEDDNNDDDFYEEEEEEVQENDEEVDEQIDEEEDEDEGEDLDTSYGRTISGTGIHRHQHKHGPHPTKPLECICGYVAAVKGNYTKHLSYYTMERKFKCELCFQRFINTTYLKQHMVRTHKEVDIDEIMKIRTGCSKCGKTFQSMKMFRSHDRIVHGSKVFGRKIKRSSNLKRGGLNRRRGYTRRFSKVKTKVQPSSSNSKRRLQLQPLHRAPSAQPGNKFACEHCDFSFAALNQLLRHNSRVHGIVHKGFAIGCKDCGIAFKTRLEHVRHRMTVHRTRFGRSKRKLGIAERDPPMPKLKNEERFTSASPLLSPQPIPIPIDNDERAAASRNVDYEQPSTSAAAAATLYEYDEEDIDESSQNNKQRHAVDSTKDDEGNFCICGASFNERKNLFCHIRRHTEKWRFLCRVCEKPFYYNSAMKRHMLMTHKVKNIYSRDKRVGCVVCGDTFGSWFDLRQHAKNLHSSKPEVNGESQPQSRSNTRASPSNPSPRKRSTTQRQTEQAVHGVDTSRAHLGHLCLCGKDFSSEKTLTVHIKYQTRERTVPCPVCNRLFICHSYMKQHMQRSHQKPVPTVKTFRCIKCAKSFNTKIELLSHAKNAHKTNQNQIGRAERASRTARALAAFRQRRKNAQIPLDRNAVHEPVAEQGSSGGFSCSCGREYLSKSALHKHIRLQTEGKVFQCQLCPRSFSEHGSLKSHMRRSHQVDYKDGGHGCGICAQVFPTHGQVVKHRIQVHGRKR